MSEIKKVNQILVNNELRDIEDKCAGRVFTSLEAIGYSEDSVTEGNPWRPSKFFEYCSVKLRPGDKILLNESYLINIAEKNRITEQSTKLFYLTRFLGLYDRDWYMESYNSGEYPNLQEWQVKEYDFVFSNIFHSNNDVMYTDATLAIFEINIPNIFAYDTITANGGIIEFKIISEGDSDINATLPTVTFTISPDTDYTDLGSIWVFNNNLISLEDALRYSAIDDIDIDDDFSLSEGIHYTDSLIERIKGAVSNGHTAMAAIEELEYHYPHLVRYAKQILMHFGASEDDIVPETKISVDCKSMDDWYGSMEITIHSNITVEDDDRVPFIIKAFADFDTSPTAKAWQVVSPREVVLFKGKVNLSGDEEPGVAFVDVGIGDIRKVLSRYKLVKFIFSDDTDTNGNGVAVNSIVDSYTNVNFMGGNNTIAVINLDRGKSIGIHISSTSYDENNIEVICFTGDISTEFNMNNSYFKMVGIY